MNRFFSNSSRILRSTSLFSSSYHTGGHYKVDENGEIIGTVDDVETLYKDLEDRMDLNIHPYPKTEDFYSMMRILFRPEDIPIITHTGMNPTPKWKVAERVGLPLDIADEKFIEMANRGIIVRLYLEGHEFIVFPEYVVGWYEFVNIHLATDEKYYEEFENVTGAKVKDVVNSMSTYMKMYAPSCDLRKGLTSILRVNPYDVDKNPEEKKMKEDHKVLTYELIKDQMINADLISVSECACKFHEVQITGIPVPEDITTRSCFQINGIAESFINCGISKEIELEDCIELLEVLRDQGHMFQSENAQMAGYFCACRKEWCGVRKAFETNGFYASHRSGFIPVLDYDSCIGCGVCVDRCPVDVLELVEIEESINKNKKEDEKTKKKKKKKKKKVMFVENGLDTCVGCLNCYWGCKVNAIDYDRRTEEETYDVAKDVFEFTVRLAYERNKMYTLLFDDPQSKTHKYLREIGKFVENSKVAEIIKQDEYFSRWFVKLASVVGRKIVLGWDGRWF